MRDQSGNRGDDAATIELFISYKRTADPQLKRELAQRFVWIGNVAARRFAHRGEPLEDLFQVAMYGVVKAVERFDPDLGNSFATFALPTVIGELRRHFRDSTWAVRVNRRVKELHLAMTGVVEQLTHELGRSPRVDEIAQRMRLSEDDIIDAIQAGHSYRASSLEHHSDDSSGESHISRRIAVDDDRLDNAADRMTVREIISRMPEREQQILYLRFFEDLTQNEIAERIGISQVHVSRLLRTSLQECRRQLIEHRERTLRVRSLDALQAPPGSVAS